MDFDRFTRSMLLAQGSFAAFLQAAPDDRAPILEQIMGMEIYSQISIRVHERQPRSGRSWNAFRPRRRASRFWGLRRSFGGRSRRDRGRRQTVPGTP